MDLARKQPRGSLSLLTLGLLFTACSQGSAAYAGGVNSSAASSGRTLPGRLVTPPSSEAKVHGTITVDFEKVTIAELLKLVGAVEKLDGVIHIVSSTARDGEPAMVVNGSQGILSVSSPETPHNPKLLIDSARRVEALHSHPVERGAALSRTGTPEFPRLAALGRLLGVKRAENSDAARAERIDPVSLQRSPSLTGGNHPEQVRAEPRATSAERFTGASAGLTAGDRFEYLASGGPILGGAIQSPWPVPGKNESEVGRSHDPQVSRVDHSTQAERSPRPETHVAGEGETFEALARRYYGDARYAWALWWANRDRIAWPDALTPGKPIMVPALGRLDPKMVMTESPASVDASRNAGSSTPRRDPEIVRASHAGPATNPVRDGARTGGFAVHVVRPEDTLRIIAREKCGDERKALEIIALNRDVLTPEGRPRVGQRLILPAAAEPAP